MGNPWLHIGQLSAIVNQWGVCMFEYICLQFHLPTQIAEILSEEHVGQ
jgi:hypothetical protein